MVWALPSACRDQLLPARLRTHRLPGRPAPAKLAVAHSSILRCQLRPAPIASSNLGDEKDPTITRALQSGSPRLGPHLPQFLVAQRQRVPDRAIDPELIIGEVNPWRRE
jgi:hypothetical protein